MTETRISRVAKPLFTMIIVLCLLPVLFGRVRCEDQASEYGLRSMQLAGDNNPLGVPVTRIPDGFIAAGDITVPSYRATPFIITGRQEISIPAYSLNSKPFAIIINSALLENLGSDLDVLTADLATDGYAVEVISVTGGTCQDIKQVLQAKYNSTGLVGALFMGDLPPAFFEVYGCFNDAQYEKFLCDLYFMDMDGVWTDNNANNAFDEHSGDVKPEIYVGRLTAGTLNYGNSSETELIRDYITKNHQYRIGLLTVEKRALMYLDDDWAHDSIIWPTEMRNAYDSVVTIAGVNRTVAGDYKAHLGESFETVQLAVHSYPNRHYFKNNLYWHSYFYPADLFQVNPPAIFFNLFACSAGDFLQPDYLGGWYIFHPNSGLASLASSKTGSMMNFNYFYNPLGQNETIGQSLVNWYTVMSNNGYADWEICWYYGMILFGDPTLRRDMGSQIYPLVLLERGLPCGTVGQPYEAHLSASGGTPPYSWNFVGGTLPEGLYLDSETGIISGLPNDNGSYIVRISVSDTASLPRADTAYFGISIGCTIGDANSDGAINVGDVLSLLYQIFYAGPEPDPYISGDCNCDLDINIADAVFLIQYIFHQGPKPGCP